MIAMIRRWLQSREELRQGLIAMTKDRDNCLAIANANHRQWEAADKRVNELEDALNLSEGRALDLQHLCDSQARRLGEGRVNFTAARAKADE